MKKYILVSLSLSVCATDASPLLLSLTKKRITLKTVKSADMGIPVQQGDGGLCPTAKINRCIKTIADTSVCLSSILFISCLFLSAYNGRKQKRWQTFIYRIQRFHFSLKKDSRRVASRTRVEGNTPWPPFKSS